MTFSAAVIGCGRMGAFTSEGVQRWAPECWFPLSHADALDAHPDVTLTSVADASTDALIRMRAVWPKVTTFTEVFDLAEQIRPQIAGVATRTVGRTEVLQTLHKAGTRAFHVEKPLCNSVRELEQLERLISRNDTHVTYGALRRSFDIYRRAVEIAEAGSLGALQEVRVNFGTAALYWTQTHAIDLILFGAGNRQVAEVQARFEHLDVDGSVVANDPVIQSATIWFQDGVAGHIGRGAGREFVLSCTNGDILVLNDGRSLVVVASGGEDPYFNRRVEPVATAAPLGTLRCVHQLVDCLRGQTRALAANSTVKQDILKGQRIAFGFVQSHREGGKPVTLNSIDPETVIWAVTSGRYA